MLAESPPKRVSTLTASYAPPSGVYDELKALDGSLRPHWHKFFEHMEAIGPKELERRWDKAKHQLHENGVSYNVYGDPRGVERPWNLSPIPVLWEPAEWESVEAGLGQRARLLDALLHDLYGPQRTLADGTLPPELVFENPSFLRAVHSINVPRGSWLPLYAADLIRDTRGTFRVLEDRTQAPSGAGYALENRIVISSALPEAFRDCHVERLAPFFRALRHTLQTLAPHNRDNPRIVLLTPGPDNATYFEQAYLAQYLGYTLVNGGDLTVREDRVFLKTLGGLSPIDVILRRVNDDYCDPLELRPESMLGVPGLVQAARAGNVAIASPLGTGLLQSPAFIPYLPRLARSLLGEELLLESVRTFWCGDDDARREGFSFFDDAVVKQTFATGFVQPIFTAELDRAAREELRQRIEAQPRRYVIQEYVHASTTPLMREGALEPRALVTRCFAVSGRDDFIVMPGGLSRVANARAGTELSMQMGAGSKDTWVLSDGPVTSFSLLPPVNRPVTLSRGGSDLPSRAADDLYWLGRYAERAEGAARLARVVSARIAELGSDADIDYTGEIMPLLRALSAQTSLIYTGELLDPSQLDLKGITDQLVASVFDEGSQGSLRSALRSTLRTGRMVRDRISTDTWRILAALDDDVSAGEEDIARDPIGTVHDVLNRVVVRLAAFSGLVMESMTRGQAWRFLDLGRRVERAMTLLMLLRGALTETCEREGPLLEAVLEIADSVMTYRRRYLATLQVAPVVDLLLTDESNPRSVIYQVDALNDHIAALPNPSDGMRTPQQRITLSVLTDLKLADIDRLCSVDERGERVEL
ncbi:MAG TPA: circularly permuted type 2 ATP-grasp protein, partial [Polyangiales bacterium]|nr:circularly permuted type 2 ATP-grasp protein [Polyangiales bacterium]